MSIEKEYVQKFINEMATIGVCDGKKVITNSMDHGQPHVHYGSIKIYLPSELPKNQSELRSCVDKAHQDKVSDQELTKLVSWLKDVSRVNPSLNNLEASWTAWHLEHPEDLSNG